jgi:hypothetical protein
MRVKRKKNISFISTITANCPPSGKISKKKGEAVNYFNKKTKFWQKTGGG